MSHDEAMRVTRPQCLVALLLPLPLPPPLLLLLLPPPLPCAVRADYRRRLKIVAVMVELPHC